jgi:hypothetical protein
VAKRIGLNQYQYPELISKLSQAVPNMRVAFCRTYLRGGGCSQEKKYRNQHDAFLIASREPVSRMKYSFCDNLPHSQGYMAVL